MKDVVKESALDYQQDVGLVKGCKKEVCARTIQFLTVGVIQLKNYDNKHVGCVCMHRSTRCAFTKKSRTKRQGPRQLMVSVTRARSRTV